MPGFRHYSPAMLMIGTGLPLLCTDALWDPLQCLPWLLQIDCSLQKKEDTILQKLCRQLGPDWNSEYNFWCLLGSLNKYSWAFLVVLKMGWVIEKQHSKRNTFRKYRSIQKTRKTSCKIKSILNGRSRNNYEFFLLKINSPSSLTRLVTKQRTKFCSTLHCLFSHPQLKNNSTVAPSVFSWRLHTLYE